MDSRPLFTLSATQRLAGGNLLTQPLLTTRDKLTFDRACAMVEQLAKEAPKLKRTVPTNARPVFVLMVEDREAAQAAKDAGHLARIPRADETFPSIGACAEALGLNAKSLRQSLYLARMDNDNEDAPALVCGVKIAYREKIDRHTED